MSRHCKSSAQMSPVNAENFALSTARFSFKGLGLGDDQIRLGGMPPQAFGKSVLALVLLNRFSISDPQIRALVARERLRHSNSVWFRVEEVFSSSQHMTL